TAPCVPGETQGCGGAVEAGVTVGGAATLGALSFTVTAAQTRPGWTPLVASRALYITVVVMGRGGAMMRQVVPPSSERSTTTGVLVAFGFEPKRSQEAPLLSSGAMAALNWRVTVGSASVSIVRHVSPPSSLTEKNRPLLV